MIQMGDQESAEKAVAHLHNCPLFGSELHLSLVNYTCLLLHCQLLDEILNAD